MYISIMLIMIIIHQARRRGPPLQDLSGPEMGKLKWVLYVCIYIYIYTYTCISLSIKIYIYIYILYVYSCFSEYAEMGNRKRQLFVPGPP